MRGISRSGWARSTGCALAALVLLATGACSPAAGQTPKAGGPSASLGAAIPTGQLPPLTQCLVDRGFWIERVEAPQASWDTPTYVLGSDLPADQAMAVTDECRRSIPPKPPKTDAEIRVIYDRWVKERTCLIGLGYQPAEPPSFEQFLSDWRSPKGPWMPIDGVDTGSWTAADYDQAKSECTLEMFDR